MNTLMNKYLNLLLRFIFMVRYMDTRKVVIVAARNVMVLIARGGMRINGMHGWIGCWRKFNLFSKLGVGKITFNKEYCVPKLKLSDNTMQVLPSGERN